MIIGAAVMVLVFFRMGAMRARHFIQGSFAAIDATPDQAGSQ
jgi:hypothetical protein